MNSDRKSKEKAALTSALDAWIERFLWTQPKIEKEYIASNRGIDDKKTAFRRYYDRLETASYEDWVSEFLLRNKTFQADISDYAQEAHFDTMPLPPPIRLLQVMQRYRVLAYPAAPPKTIGEESLVRISVLSMPRVSALHFCPASEEHPCGVAQWIWITMMSIRHSSKGEFCSFNLESTTPKDIVQHLLETKVVSGKRVTGGNRLLLSIDLSGPSTRVRETVKELLNIYLPRNSQTKPPLLKRWKRHLMVYDLHRLGVKPAAIIELIGEIGIDGFPDIDERDVRNYKENIQTLIDGGYKKYL